MPITNGYTTVAEVRGHIDDDSAVISDVLIERVINATSRAIDNYCGFPRRRFWKDLTPTTHRYVITGYQCVYVDDIASSAGLVVATDDGSGTFPVTWSATDYRLGPLNVDVNNTAYAYTKIEINGASKQFPNLLYGQPGLRVTGIHGWSEIPPEVNEACLLKAVSLLKRKDAPFGVAGFGEFGVVRIRADDPDVVDLLKSKVRHGAGTT